MPRVNQSKSETPQVVTTVTTLSKPEDEKKEKQREKLEFWSYMQKLSPEEWKRHIVYLYRTKPVVGMSSSEKYLDKFQQAFTIEDIRTRFGGEEFKAIMQRERMILHTEVFAIEAAPKFDLFREQPGGSASKDAITQQLLDRALNAGGGIEGDAMKRSLDIVTNAYKTALETTGSDGKQPNGGTDILAMIRVLKELGLIGQPPAPRGGLAEMKEMLGALKELGLIGGQTNQIETFKSMLGAVKEIAGEIGGGAGGGKRDIWGALIDRAPDLLEKGAEMLGKVATIQAENNKGLAVKAETALKLRAMGAPQMVADTASGPAAPHGEPMQGERTAPRAGGGLPVVPISDASASSGTAVSPGAAVAPSHEETILQNYLRGRVVNLISEGQSGEDVLAFVEDYFPPVIEYLEDLDPEGLRKFFADDPMLAKAMALPQWDAWFKRACDVLYSDEAVPAEPLRAN